MADDDKSGAFAPGWRCYGGAGLHCGAHRDPAMVPATPRQRTVREVKEWCLEKLQDLVGEFGLENGVRMFEEAILGQSVDPDGRVLRPVRDEPVLDESLSEERPAS